MATTYYDIIVKDEDKLLKGFIRGFQIGSSTRGGIWLGRDHPIDTKHLKEIITFRGDHVHIITTAVARKSIIAAVKEATDLDFEVVADRKIERAYFRFEFSTFSRDAASKIKTLFDSIPTGLRLLAYDPEEKIDEKAHGVELYSPVHEYEFKGKGKIEGDFEALLSFREKLAADEFVEPDDIEIGE